MASWSMLSGMAPCRRYREVRRRRLVASRVRASNEVRILTPLVRSVLFPDGERQGEARRVKRVNGAPHQKPLSQRERS
jgi:hypothetical protein